MTQHEKDPEFPHDEKPEKPYDGDPPDWINARLLDGDAEREGQ